MKRAITLDFIGYAIILLFVYAAVSKLALYNTYIFDLERSPIIGKYAYLLSVTLPVVELAVSALILFPRTRLIGLWGALLLMIVFTAYVGFILGTLPAAERPCTCGGLIRQLSWKQHLSLNIFYTALAGIGIWLQKTQLQWTRN